MSRTDLVISVREPIAIIPEAELDALREAGEGWKLAAADYYGKTLDLKAKIRDMNSGHFYPDIEWLEAQGYTLIDRDYLNELHASADATADYAARLRATDEAYRKLSVTADYRAENIARLRERVKTYRAALREIADPIRNGESKLAYHVLNSDIQDGGSDF